MQMVRPLDVVFGWVPDGFVAQGLPRVRGVVAEDDLFEIGAPGERGAVQVECVTQVVKIRLRRVEAGEAASGTQEDA